MKLGEQLKQARLEQPLTQEALAEQLGVSRQTISNWENERSYPDILILLRLSDLYGLSLDALVKGDENMIAHLEKSTNTVQSRRRLTLRVLLAAYLVVWAGSVLAYWLGRPVDAMGYSLVVFYLVLPVCTLVVSSFLGWDGGPAWRPWAALLFFGAMHLTARYATFSLAHMRVMDVRYLPDLEDALPGLVCGALGLAGGAFLRSWTARRRK